MNIQEGKNNCITDVLGVQVGHMTLYEQINEEETICTGVTAILPHERNLFTKKTRAASYVINGYGKTAGLVQINELGMIESPIMLTNTFSVGAVMQGTLHYMLQNNAIGGPMNSLNIVVGECNDSYLNSLHNPAVKPKHAIQAIENATSNRASEGAVGAGKGMVCFQYKGGIGTSSKVVTYEEDHYTFGCLVLSNFGKREEALFANWDPVHLEASDGSIMIIIATDAPLDHRQLKRVAKRSAAGLARTGSHYSHGSGDIAIAFSTQNQLDHRTDEQMDTISVIRDDHPVMNLFFQAVTEATERAILSSLQQAETTVGQKGRIIEKAPEWE